MYLSRSLLFAIAAYCVVVIQVDLCAAQIADKYYAASRAAVPHTPPEGPLFMINPVPKGCLQCVLVCLLASARQTPFVKSPYF